MSTRRSSLIAVIVLPIVLLLSLVSIGVANARTSQPAHASAAIATPTIYIHSFSFSVPTSVLHGVLVRVVNNDSVTHTVTSNKVGKFSVRVPGNSTRSFRAPSVPGQYGFHCNIHPSMKAVLKVR